MHDKWADARRYAKTLVNYCLRALNYSYPSPMRSGLPPGTIGWRPRHGLITDVEHVLHEYLPRIVSINALPLPMRNHPKGSRRECKARAQEDDQDTGRERLAFRKIGRIQDLYARSLLSLLHLG